MPVDVTIDKKLRCYKQTAQKIEIDLVPSPKGN